MSDAQFIVELLPELRGLRGSILGLQSTLDAEATKVGASSGNKFGSAMKSGITAILSRISFSKFLGGVTDVTKAYNSLRIANLNLSSSVSASNAGRERILSTLNNTNSSFEEQARVLGISTEGMYKQESASRGVRTANTALEDSIRKEERAFEDVNRVREKNISIQEKSLRQLQKENEQKLKAARSALGAGALDIEKKKLESQINQTEIQRSQRLLSGGYVFDLDQQLKILAEQKKINDNKLEQIDLQTEGIKEQGKAAEEVLKNDILRLREELSEAKNKFDIDIEPAKRKLQDLQAAASKAISGGEKVQVIDPKVKAQIQKRIDYLKKETEDRGNADPAEIQVKIKALSDRTSGLASIAGLTEAFGTLVSSGASANEAISLLDKYTTATYRSSVGSKNLDDGVNNLASSFQTENSVIGNLSGLQENYGSVIIPAGIKSLEAMYRARGILGEAQSLNYDNLSLQEKAQVKVLGTEEVLQRRLGDGTKRWDDYNNVLQSGALDSAKLQAENDKLSRELGESLAPTIKLVYEILIPLVQGFTDFANKNPELTKTIIIGAGAFLVFLTVLSGIMTVLGLLIPGFVATGVVIGAVTIPVAAVVAGIILLIGFIALLAFLVVKNWDTIKATFMNGVDILMKYLKPFGEFLLNLFVPLASLVTKTFKLIGNTIMDRIRDVINFINGVTQAIPDQAYNLFGKSKSDFKINDNVIPRFANGGKAVIPQGYPNDSYLFKAWMSSGEEVQVTPANQTINSNNTTTNNNWGNYSRPESTPSSIIFA